MSSSNEAQQHTTPSSSWEGIDLDVLASLLAVETAEQIAENWKSILLLGIVNVVTGFICLLFPFLATFAVNMVLTVTVLASGIFHIMAGCSTQVAGHQSDFYLLGGAQLMLAVLMWMHPFFTITVLTFIIAFLFMMLGTTRLAIAGRHPDMPQRLLVQLSGVAAIVMSVLICLAMPAARWITIGILLGVNLINIGFARIAVAFHGRSLAETGEYTRLPS